MNEEFPVNQYWLERGRTYFQEPRLAKPYHRLQETFLLTVLKASGIPLGRVLELGCGYGRITRLIAQHFPGTRLTALDLSPDQLARAGQYCADCSSIEFHAYDFYADKPLPENKYDAALAIEVFLHHPADRIRRILERLAAVTRHIVHIDWSQEWPWPVPQHVWLHNYPAFYRELGWVSAQFPLPEMADGQQQVLFVAAPQMSSRLLSLERNPPRVEPVRSAQERSGSAEDEGSVSWEMMVRQSLEDLRRLIPQGSQVILADNAEWAMPSAWQERRVIPFTERDGHYWGPPPDDETAWRETERLREAGATHLVLAWNAFWYRDQYPEWHRQLRQHYPCLLENERIIVFHLQSSA